MGKSTAIYCSSAIKDDAAILRQHDALTKEAEKRGWTPTGIYSDNGVIGGIEARQGLAAFKQAVQNGGGERVMTANVSRFGRNCVKMIELRAFLKRHGVELFILNESEANSNE